MRAPAIPSPKTGRELVELYFIENRTRLLEVAAFLDRLDRAAAGAAGRDAGLDSEREAGRDFRVRALREALGVLAEAADAGGAASRVERIQMLLSDARAELLPQADRKSAHGAYDRWASEGV